MRTHAQIDEDLKSLIERFQDLSRQFPRLSLVVAVRPKDMDLVEVEQDCCDGEWSTPHPTIHGRYAPQSYSAQESETNEDGANMLSIPDLSFPYWCFNGNSCFDETRKARCPGAFSHGIWAIWLHRDYGRSPTFVRRDSVVPNPDEQLKCLECYADLLLDAGLFLRGNFEWFDMPAWLLGEHGSGGELEGLDDQGGYQTPSLWWLLALAHTIPRKNVYSHPLDKSKRPIEMYVVDVTRTSLWLLDRFAHSWQKQRKRKVEETISVKPNWDQDRLTLLFGDNVVREFQRYPRNSSKILSSFQEEGWPPRIDNPLSPRIVLSEAVRELNRSLKIIRFACDGKGEGICWKVVEPAESQSNAT